MFLIPALWNYFLLRHSLMPKRLLPRVVVECVGVCASLYVSMPLSCALYPQQSTISIDKVEQEIYQKAKENNTTMLIFNKGL